MEGASNKVSFHNDLYQLKFIQKLKEKEMDLLFTIINKLKNTGRNGVVISWLELKKICSTGKLTMRNRNFLTYIEHLADVLTSIKIKISDEDLDQYHVLFPTCYNDKISQNFIIIPNENLDYMFTGLNGNFTVLDLAEVSSLQSKYSKILYYTLKKHQNKAEKTRVVEISMREFRDLLGIPDSYQMINIDKRIIEPGLKELSKYFPEIKILKIKKAVSIDRLQITWKNKIKKEVVEENIPVLEKTTSIKKTDKIIEQVALDKKLSEAELPLLSSEEIEKAISIAKTTGDFSDFLANSIIKNPRLASNMLRRYLLKS
ncbi:MAG: replication initiation protein [Fusobacteriaceae bacterium]